MSAPEPGDAPARPPRPEQVRQERLRDAVERAQARGELFDAGPLALWRERRHVLVRAALRSGRRRRLAASAAFIALPVAVIFGVAFLKASSWGDRLAEEVLLLFASFWPLVCFLTAAVSAATGVLDERDRDTALQIVLTPLPKRAIAAAKVLPAAAAPMLGLLAALPLYIWAGGVYPLALDGWPNPLALFWPLRMLAPLDLGSHVGLVLPGVLSGPLMCFTDLTLVWAAAHWGAAYAVRTLSYSKTLLLIAGRLALTVVTVATTLLAAGVVAGLAGCTFGLILSSIYEPLGVIVTLAAATAAVGWCWREFVLLRPVRMALLEFTWFDWLAYDAAEPRPPRGPFHLMRIGDRV